MAHPDMPILTFHEKTVDQLDRAELEELCGILHHQLWQAVNNFERVIAEQFPRHAVAGNA